MSDHAEHPVDYLPELALGVLPPSEAERLRSIVAECSECREELAVLSAAVELLPAATEETAPAAHVRAAVLERIATDAARTPARLPGPSRGRPAALRWALAAAAVLAVAAAGIGGYALRGGASEPAREQAVVEAAGRGDLLVARYADESLSTTLVRAPGKPDAFVWVENLPALPEGKAYQAWFTRDFEEFEPSNVFTMDAGGAWLAAGSNIDDYLAMGLTIEDEGGADEPTMAPFVVVELQRSARAREVPPFMSGSRAP